MDQMWGDTSVQETAALPARAEFFDHSNYGMFIHWGLYSHLGGQWKGETFYGECLFYKLRCVVHSVIGDSRYHPSRSSIRPCLKALATAAGALRTPSFS